MCWTSLLATNRYPKDSASRQHVSVATDDCDRDVIYHRPLPSTIAIEMTWPKMLPMPTVVALESSWLVVAIRIGVMVKVVTSLTRVVTAEMMTAMATEVTAMVSIANCQTR